MTAGLIFVKDSNLVPRVDELKRKVVADEPSSTNYKNFT